MNCQHWLSSGCKLAGALCGQTAVPTTTSVCSMCVLNQKPMDLNNITATLAFQWAFENNIELPNERRQFLSRLISQINVPEKISIIVTTYGTDTLYTQTCLESIRSWKNDHHELIVVTHDESPLLRAYLDACAADGLIDKLVLAISGHGHTRGYNLGVQYSSGDVIFNICNDMIIGPSLVDDCAWQLRHNHQIGLIGWHWYSEGVIWQDGKIFKHTLRDPANQVLGPNEERAICTAPWFTGRYFEGIGGKYWIHLCNTSFFGVRRKVLEMVGGGFGPEYSHYWADDLLNYAVLDQGLDILHFDPKFRRSPYFAEFHYENLDVIDRRRHEDSLRYTGMFLDVIGLMDCGMTVDESVFLHLLAKSLPDASVLTNIGVYLGSSVITLLDAMRSKRATFFFVDCFDLPGSELPAQPPVTQDEFLRNIQPYIGKHHTVHVLKTDTLKMDSFPKSDLIFVDAAHTKKYVEHDAKLAHDCLNINGIAVFHDYHQPAWPDVTTVLDERFAESNLEVYRTMAVYRHTRTTREAYQWPNRR